MANIVADIENLNHDIEKTDLALDSLFLELGKVGSQYHMAIAYEKSNDAFNSLCKAVDAYDSVTSHICEVEDALKMLDSSDREIKVTNVTIHDLDTRQETLLSSLGAVALEIENAGNMPSSLLKCMTSIHEYESKLKHLTDRRDNLSKNTPVFILELVNRRIDLCKKKIDRAFLETGKKLLSNEDLARQIESPRIHAILDEINVLRENRKNIKSYISNRQKSISNASDSLKNDNTTLRELLVRQKDCLKTVENCYTCYGRIISEGMDLWLDDQAPLKLKNVCQRIKIENKRLNKQRLNLEYLVAQKSIMMNNSQIEMLEIQISHLKNQRSLIDKQIDELESKRNNLLSGILVMEDKKKDIARNALA